MFPPGRAKLAISLSPTGSIATAKTMGIVVVACLAACAAGVLGAKIRSTFHLKLQAVRGSSHGRQLLE